MLQQTKALRWMSLLCLAVFFFPVLDYKSDPTCLDIQCTLGVPSSPWLVASWIDKEEKIENGMSSSFSKKHSHYVSAELISWSTLLGIVGMVLMKVSVWRKAKDFPPG